MPEKSIHKDEITLREAAELSGYSADYIGQLIRKGKLPGRQVYTNVSWVTTPEAIDAYMERSSGGAEWFDRYMSLERVQTLYQWVSGACIAFLLLFVVFLLYVLAVSVDRSLERTYVTHSTEIATSYDAP
ncbi:MAG: helix-turn-helix domain-containing protein [Candidatus Pacebacteria bacterium]|nr:helix-turn-helix domain-containing protein [Candidatus Paceibacterota bacterium]